MRTDAAHATELRKQVGALQTWMELGAQHVRGGRLALAQAQFEKVLAVAPEHLEAINQLGNVLLGLGSYPAALRTFEKGASLAPQLAQFQVAIGNAYQAMGRYEESILSYATATALNPNYAEAFHNLGSALYQRGQFSEAVVNYSRAIQISANYVDAHANLGNAYVQLRAFVQAEKQYRTALRLNPAHLHAQKGLAYLTKETDPEGAIELMAQAVSTGKADLSQAIVYGKLLHQQGKTEEARDLLGRCEQVAPNPGLRAFLALSLPVIMGTRDAVARSRARFESNLETLLQSDIQILDPIAQQCETNFFLAFHGTNDCNLQKRVAEFYVKACPPLAYVAPHCKSVRAPGKRRIGFYSKYIARHSVAVSYSRMIECISANDEFEVILISTGESQETAVKEIYPEFHGKYLPINTLDLSFARKEISELELDVLAYLDIGMEPFGYFLGFSKLARAQFVLGGHPDTTGLPHMDYFISNDLAEPENAQEAYSEKLVRMRCGAYYFGKVPPPPGIKSRAELGLPVDKHVYACPMTLFKLHPDFDVALDMILQRDPSGVIVLFEDKQFRHWRRILEERFASTISERVRSRVTFMPWVANKLDFISILHHCEVVLDPFHFGLGTTAIPIYSIGTPCVTKPSQFARGRYGYYYSIKLGVEECVAKSVEEYVDKAVAIATNPQLRSSIKEKILRNNSAIFDRTEGIAELISIFKSLDTSGR